MSRILARIAGVFLAAGTALAFPPRPVALVLDDVTAATHAAAAGGVASLGGRVLHDFDGVLVVELPAGAEFRALRLPGVREVALNGVPLHAEARPVPGWGLAAWNAISHQQDKPHAAEAEVPVFDEPDALVPPEVSLDAVRAASRAFVAAPKGTKLGPAPAVTFVTGAPFGATELNTSEFLAGAVSVNVILVESDGSLEMSSENWSADRESEVVARIAAGLEWVRVQEPQASLHFVYHVVSGRVSTAARTGYEPIRHPADPTGLTGEDLWVKQVLGKMGYTSGDRFVRSRALASDTRRVDGTDWAVNVFVVDSLNDTDGRFADGRFAYTWIGGPHLVMTYDNQAWGIGRMDMVLRHELLHAFYAYDEYAQSGCLCADHRGYLDGVNANCTVCNATAGACVMISNDDAMCDATRRQIGWSDLDDDGAIDVIGEDPDTFLDAVPAQACVLPPLAGLATVVAATNRNPSSGTPRSSISVNRIATVEVRADGQSWVAADPEDGSWGSAQERFRATLPPLAAGSHRLEARAIDDRGNVDRAPATADVMVAAGAASLGDTLRIARAGLGGATVSWAACAGAVTYRVYRAASPSSPWAPVAETPSLAWNDDSATPAYFAVRPVDACGTEASE
jgi:hypothetical protein